MPIRNLITWPYDAHPRLLGYDVVVDGGAPVRVKSNAYYDTTTRADVAAADAAEYVITRVVSMVDGQMVDDVLGEPTLVTPTQSRWPIDTSVYDLCVVAGSLRSVCATVEGALILYAYQAPGVPAMPVPALGYPLGWSAAYRVNCLGEFSVPLARLARVVMYAPDAALRITFVVPDAPSVNISAVAAEPAPLHWGY